MRTTPAHSAFTLVELLSTIAIMAILTTAALVYIPSYINFTKLTANSATLDTLVKALENYKLMGGIKLSQSLGGPNTQAKIIDVVAALKTGVTVNGSRTPFINSSQPIDATLAYATGKGNSFSFCGYGATQSGQPNPTFSGVFVPRE